MSNQSINKNVRKQSRYFTAHKKQAGMSIISVLLGVIVAAALAWVVIKQFQDANTKTRIETASSEVIQIISESQKMYGMTNQYAAVTTAIAVRGGAVPGHRRIGTTDAAVNNYNGAIEFAPVTINTTSDSLGITFQNVRGTDCQPLVLNTAAMARQVFVGSTQVKATDGDVNLATLSSACDTTTTAIRWVAGRG